MFKLNNIIVSIVLSVILIIWMIFICKKIENKKLKRCIRLFFMLLLFWILLRVVKYEFINDYKIKILFWYLYYFPILLSVTMFMYICTWNGKNKSYIKIIKELSYIGSMILIGLIITNNFHNLVFKIDISSMYCENNYSYGIVYYICLGWIFINLLFSIGYVIKESRGAYRIQKFIIFALILLLVCTYAFGYMIRTDFVFRYARDFTVIYCICFMLALLIVVYKEKYRQTLEGQLYEAIEDAIKEKALLINKKINNISKSENLKKDLAYIKMLVGYCKRKSNLIVIERNKEEYESVELELFIKEILADANTLGINGGINIVNKFRIPVYVTSILYSYISNVVEYCSEYNNTNILLSIKKARNEIIINTMIESSEELKEFKYNFEMSQLLNGNKISEHKSIDYNIINIVLMVPINKNYVKKEVLTEKEIPVLLNMKSKVHDILGQRLSIVNTILQNENIDEEKINEIKPLLKNILDDLEDEKQINSAEMLDQIVNTCKLAGTKVYIMGDLPKDNLKAVTLVKIIRECSTNAIRHALASNIYIRIINNGNIEMTVSNDGMKVSSYIEGDGIRGIRNRLDELNGSLEIEYENEFTVKVKI